MRSTVAVLAAFAVALIAPTLSFAQDDEGGGGVDMKKRQKGKAEAPALLAQTNRTCAMTDAVHLGAGKQKDAAGKQIPTNLYEMACSDGPGMILLSTEGQPTTANDCLQYATAAAANTDKKIKPLVCTLPTNAKPEKGLEPILAKAGTACTVTKARWMGYSPSALLNQYEALCADGNAYILSVPATGSTRTLAIDSCVRSTGQGVACEYMTKEQVTAAISQLATASGRQCQVNNARFVGTTASKVSFYEIGCADEKAGYMFEVDAANRFVRAIDCAKAGNLAGGCAFTNTAVAENEQAGTYTKLAGQIGYKCDVKSYRTIGVDSQKREVVELVCANAADSGVAFLPTGAGQKGEYFNCIRASARSLRCGLVPESATFARLTAQVSSKGKACTVSAARGMGSDPAGAEYVEVACSGQPGMVIKYGPGGENVQDVLACSASKGIGGCKLS